jgi:uncharacterized damage-inducible protein DinB
MTVGLSVNDLLDYTDWERRKWQACLGRQGEAALGMAAGPNGDGRFETVGDLIKHIFSAEKRYVERLTGRPLTDPASIPNARLEEVFEFGQKSRSDLKDLIDTFPADEWDAMKEFKILNFTAHGTPRKIVMHVLIHEIRHWAQIGTLLRLNGVVDDFHDFAASPVLGGGFVREDQAAGGAAR